MAMRIFGGRSAPEAVQFSTPGARPAGAERRRRLGPSGARPLLAHQRPSWRNDCEEEPSFTR
eukprot:753668-Alexandrium_andersonii.AAC.1